MKFEIGKFTVSKFDKLNWIVREKVKVDAEHRFAKKAERKKRFKQILVGYYGSLSDAKAELGERLAKDSENYKEFCKWLRRLKEIETH